MKIISQSAAELVLKEGNALGIAIGIVLVIAAVPVGYGLHSSGSVAIWAALALFVVGLAVILFSSSITVNANKTSGQLLYQKKRLIGAQNLTYAIADILRIETRRQWRMQSRSTSGNRGGTVPQPVLVSQSVIVFKNGRELPLDHQKTASSISVGPVLMAGKGKEAAIASQVANFLGVPFQEIAPPNGGMRINLG